MTSIHVKFSLFLLIRLLPSYNHIVNFYRLQTVQYCFGILFNSLSDEKKKLENKWLYRVPRIAQILRFDTYNRINGLFSTKSNKSSSAFFLKHLRMIFVSFTEY